MGCFSKIPIIGPILDPKVPDVPVDNSAQIAAQQAEAKRVADEAARAQALQTFNNSLAAAKASAKSTAESRIAGKGLPVSPFTGDITSEIDRLATTVPQLDTAPGQYFPDTLADDVLNRKQSSVRSNYGNTVNTKFGPGYDTTAIPDTLDDPILDAINDTGYNNALQTVQRAQARGQINDQGYNSALTGLGEQKKAAAARLQQLGGTVLGTGRSKLAGVRDEASSAASNWDINSLAQLNANNTDPNATIKIDDGADWFKPYQTKFDTTLGGFNSNLEGDIRNTVGSTDFYDPNALISSEAAKGGTTSGNLLASVLASRKKNAGPDRGLGSSGTF